MYKIGQCVKLDCHENSNLVTFDYLHVPITFQAFCGILDNAQNRGFLCLEYNYNFFHMYGMYIATRHDNDVPFAQLIIASYTLTNKKISVLNQSVINNTIFYVQV